MLSRATALFFLGLGMASCGTKDPGPDTQEVPRLEVLRENARLLGVDERQRFLLFTDQNDSGTYAKLLPLGVDTRISDPAQGATLAQDGSVVLLWSAPDGAQARTRWLWRPGSGAGIPFTTRSTGDAVHDRALSYLAFTETDAGTTSLRVMDTATCTQQACPLRTVLEVPGNLLSLQVGGKTVLAFDAKQGWLIDVPSGAVTELGPQPEPPTLSPDGAHYILFDGAGHLQVFDTATRTLQWERPWAQDVSRAGWKVGAAVMTDAKLLVVNIYEPPPPGSIPLVRATLTCDATSCRGLDGGDGNCGLAGRGDLVSCSRQVRCGPYGCEYNSLYFDASMRLLSNTSSTGARQPQPAFSADLTQNVSLYRDSSSDRLIWNRPEGGRELALQGYLDTNICTFLPGAERVVFAQRLTRSDGVSETRLWTWDGTALKDELALPSPPSSLPVVRASPTTLYVNVEAADRNYSHIARIRLQP
ncbi:hypothetical protein D7X55_06290 [Corallococcus sp. AB049A]|nr:hypothetical protein D7X55_06290 [Corallococcus sp. AB049A]